MDVLSELLGRLHPLVVHLPIGFLAVGGLLYLRGRRTGENTALLQTLFLWTALAGAGACLSGYLLYSTGGYSYDTVKGHLWFGIATTLLCFLLYAREKPAFPAALKKISLPVLLGIGLLGISITGHKGGTLTHGEGYLTEPLPRGIKKVLGIPVFEEVPLELTAENWQETDLYQGVIHPILNNKCGSCHGPTQAKGGLRLHLEEAIRAGGKDGPVLDGHPGELIERIDAPREAEGHMPPEDQKPLLREEIALLKAWAEAGHPFEGTIGDLGLDRALFEPFILKVAADYYPENNLAPLPADSLTTARQAGLHVELLSRDLPWLRVSALNMPGFSVPDTVLLNRFRGHVADLDLSHTRVNDSLYPCLRHLTNLTVLNLSHTAVTDQGLEQLASLPHLKSLNLNHTQITPAGLAKLERFPALEKLYVFGTSLPEDGPKTLKNGTVTVEYGGYVLPGIASDSIVY